MRIKFAILGSILCIFVGPAFAADSVSGEEHVGVSSGIVIGAMAGGPGGAILGAVIGGKLGEVFSERKEEVAVLSNDLNGSRSRVNDLERDIVALNDSIESLGGDVERLRSVARPDLLSLMQAMGEPWM